MRYRVVLVLALAFLSSAQAQRLQSAGATRLNKVETVTPSHVKAGYAGYRHRAGAKTWCSLRDYRYLVDYDYPSIKSPEYVQVSKGDYIIANIKREGDNFRVYDPYNVELLWSCSSSRKEIIW